MSKKEKILTNMTKTYKIYVKDIKKWRCNMTSKEIESISKKLAYLERVNPLKFENFKGRVEALYEIEIEKDNKSKSDKN